MPDLKLKRWSDRDVEIDPVLAFNYPIKQDHCSLVNSVYFKFNVVIYIRFLEA